MERSGSRVVFARYSRCAHQVHVRRERYGPKEKNASDRGIRGVRWPGGDKTRRYPALALLGTFGLVSIFVLPPFVRPARAVCKQVSDTEYTCTGDLSEVRANGSNSFPPDSAQKINVQDLTANIPQGIFYSAGGKNDQPVDLVVTTGNFKVQGQTTTRGIILETTGFAGADRKSDTTGKITGGTSAAGGSATLTLDGEVVGSTAFSGPAISIESISGRGGNGANFDVLTSAGGKGGISDPAGTVTLSIAGPSTVSGTGISMSSSGGSGGKGGTSVCCNGGSGGPGGRGGEVTVVGSGGLTIDSSGSSSVPGLLMYSQGGEGGSGKSFGDGGDGGSGGTGVVTALAETSADVTTSGERSTGVIVQSIGGGGGTGGSAISANVSTGESKALEASIGRSGGSGGDSGQLSMAINGSVTTTGDQSGGILAQSIGGGGGTGSLTGSLLYGSTSSGTEKGIAFTVGGTSGGGVGGAVRVTDSGGITTYDNASHALYAQSIGGSGGLAGDLGGIGTDDASNSWDAAIAIGGGGAAGSGGAVTIDASGSKYATGGDGAYAIYAQSIGGGGGDGGSGAGLSDTESSDQTTKNAKLAIDVGGQDGSSGDGGPITLTLGDTTTVRTAGTASIGVFAQSVGGGGGVGGAGAAGLSGTVTVGGSGSSSGSGKVVSVTSLADIATGGSAAHGIVAQSVGGGGGYAGSVVVGSAANFGSGIDNGTSGDTSGDGGAVTVNASGSIATTGGSSIGIFAQSVGGGGGVVGTAEADVTGSSATAQIGSGGGSGAGGAISVTFSAGGKGISTDGAGAHGIFAQSAGGSGTTTMADTMVSVIANGDVLASGAGAHGIYAQSAGDGMGAIEVTVGAGAAVQGGGKAMLSGTEDRAGVFVKGGTGGSITNNGTISSILGSDGVAINVTDTTVSIDNSGTITGQILKASGIDLLNRRGGVIDAGPLLDVDSVRNRGTLAVGVGAVGASELTGSLTQSDSGVLIFDLDPSRPTARNRTDRLSIGGRAELDGRIRIAPLDPWQPMPGRQAVPLLRADGGLSADGLDVVPSVVAQYRLRRPDSASIGLSYDIDFSNSGILAETNSNQDGVAQNLHDTYRGRALDDDVARVLIAVEDTSDYTKIVNTLGAEVVVDCLSSEYFGDREVFRSEGSGSVSV